MFAFRRLVTMATAACVSSRAIAQIEAPRPVELPRSREHSFRSRINGRDYLLWVALPRNYFVAGDTTHYDVVYLLDGRIELPAAATAYRAMTPNPRDDRLIFVGILYPAGIDARQIDFAIPPLDSTIQPDPRHGRRPTTEFGGAAFLRVMRDEVIPLVDRTYRTSRDRGIIGHSYGGLFATYALFEDPTLFTRYGICSPSLWWDDDAMFVRETHFARTHRALPASVYISIGQFENPTMMQAADRLAATLRARNYTGLRLSVETLGAEDHASSFAEYSHVLQALYLHSFDTPMRDPSSANADSVRRAFAEVIAAYQRRDVVGVLKRASRSSFQGIVDNTIADDTVAMGTALRKQFDGLRTLRITADSLRVDFNEPSWGVAIGKYREVRELRSGRSEQGLLDVACEFVLAKGRLELRYVKLTRVTIKP